MLLAAYHLQKAQYKGMGMSWPSNELLFKYIKYETILKVRNKQTNKKIRHFTTESGEWLLSAIAGVLTLFPVYSTGASVSPPEDSTSVSMLNKRLETPKKADFPEQNQNFWTNERLLDVS